MDENELLELSGTVDSVNYKNEENGYTVLRLRDENGEGVTVVGCFPYAAPGESMIVSGNWVSHSVHGRQFKAEFSQRMLPSTAPAMPSSSAPHQPEKPKWRASVEIWIENTLARMI